MKPSPESACLRDGHNFTLVSDADTRKNTDAGTEIWRTLYCTKCAETKSIRVALWGKRKESGNDPF